MNRILLVLFSASLLNAGCTKEQPKPEKGGIQINVPGVNVKVGDGGVSVDAPGASVKTGPGGTEVKAPGANVKVEK